MAVFEIEDMEDVQKRVKEESEPTTEEKPEEKVAPETEEVPVEDTPETEEEVVEEPEQNETVPKWQFDKNYRLRKEAERKVEYLEKQLREKKEPPREQISKPRQEDFETTEEYLDARDAWRDQERQNQRVQASQQEQIQKKWATFDEKKRKLFSDDPEFDQKATVPLDLVPLVADLDVESLKNIAVYFFDNPDHAFNIANMSDVDAALEIGRLEGKLGKPKKVKPKTETKAPTPTKSVDSELATEKKITDYNTKSESEMEAFMNRRNKEEGYL